MKKYLGLFLCLSTSFAWTMEKQAAASLVSIASKQFEKINNDLTNNALDEYVHALRNFAQLLYYHDCYMRADKETELLMKLITDTDDSSPDLSSLLNDYLQRLNNILNNACFSLTVMQSYKVSDGISRILRCIQSLQEYSRPAVKEQRGAMIEIELNSQDLQLKQKLDDEYERLYIRETYEMVVRKLKQLILKNGPKNRALYAYSNTTPGEMLPLKLSQDKLFSQEEKAVNNASISVVTNQATGKKKKKRRKRKKTGGVQALHREDPVEPEIQLLEEPQ